jgi:hypothetical protein
MAPDLDPRALADALTATVYRDVPSAALDVQHEDDDYWCISWRINNNADRELFVEHPGPSIAPGVLRVGVYFRDAPDASATATRRTRTLEALTEQRDALTALGAVCTFTSGSSTRDTDTVAWQTHDLVHWLTVSCANRDLVWRWDLEAGPPTVEQLISVLHSLVPVWRRWNSL